MNGSMIDIIESVVQRYLQEYQDKIAELVEEADEIYRRLGNQIRVGTVAAVDPQNALVKVKHGDNLSPFIRFFVPAAGQVKEYRCPSVGEQSLLINYAAGDNSSQAFALCGFYCDRFPPPSTNLHEHCRVYPNGSKFTIDHNSNQAVINHVGDLTIKITGNLTLDIGGIITEKAQQHIANKR
ncbi:phage baseplate assembly protein V [Spartinivicinus ruber]|uniref:phage baseplate assembly protein V n=1 Tax=Spartinivicinus ruber TaxID=2683272 RepID=UPI0013D6E403|nr:phage baseplate assembly protein V [Spartinivicinus ruber]